MNGTYDTELMTLKAHNFTITGYSNFDLCKLQSKNEAFTRIPTKTGFVPKALNTLFILPG